MSIVSSIAAIPDGKAREAAYITAANTAILSSDSATARAIIDAVADENAPVALSKNVSKSISSQLQAQPAEKNQFVEGIAEYGIEKFRSRVGGGVFEEADYSLRFLLYNIYWAYEDYLRAASVFAQARIDSPSLPLQESERAHSYVRVAQAYLKADDDVSADRFIKRASDYVFHASVGWETQVQYKACYAQILDAKRKFLEAAARYIELAHLPPSQAEESDLLAMLERAVKCVVVAPAGPQRQRVMGTLYRDERLSMIDHRCYGMLERMYMERFVSPADAEAFEGTLAVHQKALMSDGTTVFAKAIIEHNMFAAARVYNAITLTSLATLLGIDVVQAERTAVRMISELRVAATIDQVDGMMVFATTGSSGRGGGGGSEGNSSGGTGGGSGSASASGGSGAGGVDALTAWDARIKDACLGINTIVEGVTRAYPIVQVLMDGKK